jgi:surfactin synthase thioesterase subunit
VFGCSVGGIYMHELAHQQFFRQAGVSTHFEVSGFKVLTVPENSPTKELSNLDLANAFNEAVTYNLIPQTLMIGLILFCGFIYLGDKRVVK